MESNKAGGERGVDCQLSRGASWRGLTAQSYGSQGLTRGPPVLARAVPLRLCQLRAQRPEADPQQIFLADVIGMSHASREARNGAS